MSAPVSPTEPAASRSRSTSLARGMPRVWTLEDCQAALVGGAIDRDMAVETARPQQGRIEHVGPVRGGHDDHGLGLREAVHLAEDLVERLLAFVVSAAHAGAAMPADGVDLVDEEDAGRAFLGRGEQIADPARAHADEHLDELRAVDAVERHARLAGHRPAQQGLAGARRAHEQDSLGHAAAEALEFLRILQEFDDFLEFGLDALQPGHVVERDGTLALFVFPGGALAEAENAAAAEDRVLRSPQHVENRSQHQQRQADHGKQVQERHGIGRRRDLEFVAQLGKKQLDEVRVVEDRNRGRELFVQLDWFSRLTIGFAWCGVVRGRIDEFARNLQSLEVNAVNFPRYELLAEEPVSDLRGTIEDRPQDHENDHAHDDGDNEPGRDATAGRRRGLRGRVVRVGRRGRFRWNGHVVDSRERGKVSRQLYVISDHFSRGHHRS